MKILYSFALVVLLISSALAEPFADLVGPIEVKPVVNGPLVCPYISWGADCASFIANGTLGHASLTTLPNSAYAKLGVNVSFYKQDQFVVQVRDYLSGKTPFLRCTFSMLGPASEILGEDPRTKPVVISFVSFSKGDHLIAREGIKTLNDLKALPNEGVLAVLKKRKIAVQQGGPHVGWLLDLLSVVKLNKNDVKIVWCKETTGPGSPPDLFRTDPTIDACFAISPDMVGLTSGLDKVGSGAEGTVKGAHVLVSTAQETRAIADVVAVRSDFYTENKDLIEKFVAGYMNGTSQLIALRKNFEDTKKMSPVYQDILTVMQSSFGKDVIPDIAVDGHGLLEDCNFGGTPGNQSAFFSDKQSGFEPQMKAALDMGQSFGYIKVRRGFDPVIFDYQHLAALAGVPFVQIDLAKPKLGEGTIVFPDNVLDDKTIASFTIHFEPNQQTFSIDQYGAEFEKVLNIASKFGGCAVIIRGHADPTQTLVSLLKSGMAKGLIKRTGVSGNFQYFFNGHPLDLTQTATIVDLIKAGAFDGPDDPRQTMQAALDLSFKRAQAVTAAILELAKKQNIPVDVSQIQPVGAGISEPVIAKPKNIDEARRNMRVEFMVKKVKVEVNGDFSY